MTPPSPDLFRQAWGKFPTGVSLITTQNEAGIPYCTTANAVSSVSLDPLLLQVSLGKDGVTCANIRRERRFGINILREGREEMAAFYARATPEERQRLPVEHHVTEHGTVVLDDAIAAMDCHVLQTVEAGDHVVFIAQVDEIEIHEGAPLVFYEGGYTSLSTG